MSKSFLSAYGIESLAEVPLLLPRRYIDLRNPVLDFAGLDGYADGDEAVLKAVVAAPPTITRSKGNGERARAKDRTRLQMRDEQGHALFGTIFGDADVWAGKIQPGTQALFHGHTQVWDGKTSLLIKNVYGLGFTGRTRPVYPGKQSKSFQIAPESVYEYMRAVLPSAIDACERRLSALLGPYIHDRLMSGGSLVELAGLPADRVDFATILKRAHFPMSPAEGEWAVRALDRLAAIYVAGQAVEHHAYHGRGIVRRIPVSAETVEKRIGQLPFSATEEQRQAIYDIVAGLQGDQPLRHILSGDVGTGKTAVFAAAAACALDHGAYVAIMLPRGPLAEQVHREMIEFFPDLALGSQLVTGETKRSVNVADIPLVVGTHALIHRDTGERDFVIVDEQQKFSLEQRNALTSRGGHLLEASATCIPRSQALMEFGILSVSQLTKPHKPKQIHTRSGQVSEDAQIVKRVQSAVASGHQALVVYPLKEGKRKARSDKAKMSPIAQSVDEALVFWEEAFPGRVVALRGDVSDEEKIEAIAAMLDNRADVLISTTVVEVGINLPRLRYVGVVDPQYHGLSVLHQIRGRAARKGGDGWCDLLVSEDIDEDAKARLQILVDTQSGYEVAERELTLRGFGDVGQGDRQSGKVSSFLPGRHVTVDGAVHAAKIIKAQQESRISGATPALAMGA